MFIQVPASRFSERDAIDSSVTGADSAISQPNRANSKGPYAPKYATSGNPPHEEPDTAVSALFLALFFIVGLLHLLLLILNKRQGRKFVFSGLVFFFCLIRLISCALRIAWVYEPENISLSIAAELLVNVGTAILFVTNNWFTQRVMRAKHPHIGWNKIFDIFITKVTELIIVATVVTLIVIGVHQFYTTDPQVQQIEHVIQQVCQTIFAVLAFLPLPIGLLMLIVPRRTYIDKFGSGRFRTKIIVLMFSAAILTLESGFRAGVLYTDPVPIDAERPWYLSDVYFYIFGLTIEWVVVAMYLIVRVDKRFYVPDKAFGPGVYSGDVTSGKHRDSDDDYWVRAVDERSLQVAAHVASLMSPSTRTLPRASGDIEAGSQKTVRVMDYTSRQGSFEVGHKTLSSRPSSAFPAQPLPPDASTSISHGRSRSMNSFMTPSSSSMPGPRPRSNSASIAGTRPSIERSASGNPAVSVAPLTTKKEDVPPVPPPHQLNVASQTQQQGWASNSPPTIRVVSDPDQQRPGRPAPATSSVRMSSSPTQRSQSLPRQSREVHMYQYGFQPPGMNPPSYRLIEQGRVEQVRKQRQLDTERQKKEIVERARRESDERRIRRESVEAARRASAERQRRGSAERQKQMYAADQRRRDAQPTESRQPPAYDAGEIKPQRRYDGLAYDLPSTYIGIGI